MKFPAKFNPLFDRFLLGGLGCGFIALCFVISAFFYVWQNPPQPGPTRTPLVFEGLTTVTPGPTATALFQFATPSPVSTGVLSLSPTPTQASAIPGIVVPSPVPQSQYANTSPTGKI